MKSVRESSGRRRREPAGDAGGEDTRAATANGWGTSDDAEPSDLAPVVGANLRRLRSKRGLSLEKLAQRSGVSRAMLGQIELGQSAPTINVLWKIARALDVTFATLIQAREAGGTTVLRRASAKVLTSQGGAFSSRALFPFDGPRRAELYELRLASGATEEADAHAPGTMENLVLVEGELEIRLHRPGGLHENHRLEAGDAIVFEADVRHAYVNVGTKECLMYLAMTYADANP